jgi:lysophospholipase L1-like esterase
MHALPSIRALGALLGLAFLASMGAAPAAVSAGETKMGPQAGQKVAFLGDSITANGMQPGGYVTLTAMGLKDLGREITVIPAGVSGNTSKDMLARLDRDVLSKKPDWMTLSCGVNDVWHKVGGVELDAYQQNITAMVDQATAAGIKVIILAATMITEDPAAPDNVKLAGYNDFLRQFAAQRHLPFADLNADMRAAVAREKTAMPKLHGNVLTVDGVHMNGLGNEMMAAGVLKAMGCSDAQIAQEKAKWVDLPDGAPVQIKTAISVRQYQSLQAAAAAESKSVEELLAPDLARDVQNRASAAEKAGSPAP